MTNEHAKVLEHEPSGGGCRRLAIEAPEIAHLATPGQFVHLRVPALERTALRRPFSIFHAAGDVIEILYKTVGRGTAALHQVAPGDTLEVEGPLGRGFPENPDGTALLVGGGYGVAPLFFLAARLVAAGRKDVEVFVGGRTAGDLLAIDRFRDLGVEVFTATEDGSAGTKGFAVAPLDAETGRLAEAGAKFEFFACGPDGLLKAVSERAVALGAPGWISTDRHMICGVGACYACIQCTTGGNARCCVDGPVFPAADLVW